MQDHGVCGPADDMVEGEYPICDVLCRSRNACGCDHIYNVKSFREFISLPLLRFQGHGRWSKVAGDRQPSCDTVGMSYDMAFARWVNR
jgi:hypothetical protein